MRLEKRISGNLSFGDGQNKSHFEHNKPINLEGL
jgi:hypothetical protein